MVCRLCGTKPVFEPVVVVLLPSNDTTSLLQSMLILVMLKAIVLKQEQGCGIDEEIKLYI